MSYTISVSLNESEINKILNEHDGLVGRFGQNFATQVTRASKARSPVRTGLLQSSLSTRTVGGGGAVLGWEISGVYYLEYVEAGIPSGKPNFFVAEAVAEVASRFF